MTATDAAPIPRPHAAARWGLLFVVLALALGGAWWTWARQPDRVAADQHERLDRIDASLARAGRWLLKHQSPDGAWRSETYGVMRDGIATTPHVLESLTLWPEPAAPKPLRDAQRRGQRFVASLARRDPAGRPRIDAGPAGLAFPTYTSSEAVAALTDAKFADARAIWRDNLLAHQLAESNGWSPDDLAYGGWSYSVLPPQKPPTSQPAGGTLLEPNVSATTYAVAGLGASATPAQRAAALAFLQRCQNWSATPDPVFDDGGFHFCQWDQLKNKPGLAGTDARGQPRFYSYGTMTADGLRTMLACGLTRNDPRVAAAHRWLTWHFDPARQPGAFAEDRELFRHAMYYYWCNAAARALVLAGDRAITTHHGQVDWAAELADRLVHLQRNDGTWRNEYTDSKEDDPLVSVPLATAALSLCRDVLAKP